MHQSRSLPELKQLLPADVCPITFGVAVHEHGKATLPVKNDGSIATRLSRTAANNSLFDDAFTQ
jgi:hypothetical protein